MSPFYFYKIDSLRGIAVSLVVLGHWIPKLSSKLPLGAIGVDIFFVISGFLITSNLIRDRYASVESSSFKISQLKVFFIKRILRIFPLYYLSLFLFWQLESVENFNLKENIFYYLTYTVNFLYFFNQNWSGYISPLWSLSVEEQFYLVWPFFLIYLPKSRIPHFLISCIVLGLSIEFFAENPFVRILTPACMSALGAGALLAWLHIQNRAWIAHNLIYILIAGGMGFLGLGFFLIFSFENHMSLLLRLSIILIAINLIIYCLGIFKSISIIDFFLTNTFLLNLGKISYGIYLYHNMSPIVWREFINPFMISIVPWYVHIPNIVLLIFKSVLLYGVAYFSYNYFETPFLKLKQRLTINASKVG